jgi:deoxyadenosine/deoxycytidine kinase
MDKPSLILEIIGPAGAGKTSLSDVLHRFSHKVSLVERPKPRDIRNMPFFLGNGISLLPALLRLSWNEGWLTFQEAKQMAYLNGMYRILRRRNHNQGVIVLDQGPIFDLARLSEFGPRKLTSSGQWWQNMLCQWALTLDMVVWLDAPDDILMQRIWSRDKWHVAKAKSEHETLDYLRRYRSAYTNIMSKLSPYSQIKVLTFSTNLHSINQIAQTVLKEIVIDDNVGQVL